MKLVCAGGFSRGPQNALEWFPNFNYRFVKDYLSSFDVELLPNAEVPIRGNGFPKYDLFGRRICINLNNLLIANAKTEKFVLITSFYDLRQLVNGVGNLDTERMITCFTGHYTKNIIEKSCGDLVDVLKFKPWYFRSWHLDFGEHDQYFKSYNPTVDRLFFRGVDIPDKRGFIDLIEKEEREGIDVKNLKMPFDLHERACEESGVCLSAPGIRDMCNRDVEYWKGGIPFIRPRFTNELAVEIPDDVYIPVDYETCCPNGCIPDNYPTNFRALADSVIEKFEEVRSDTKLLNEISKAGKGFYEEFFSYPNIGENTFKMIEESGLFES